MKKNEKVCCTGNPKDNSPKREGKLVCPPALNRKGHARCTCPHLAAMTLLSGSCRIRSYSCRPRRDEEEVIIVVADDDDDDDDWFCNNEYDS